MVEFVNLTLSGITNGMVYAAVALALVLIWRATRIVNFAQGGMLMLTTFIAWSIIDRGGSYWTALAAALVAGLVLGAVIERLVIRPVENKPPLNAVIVTLGLLVVLQAVAGMIWGGQPRSYPPAFTIQGFTMGDTGLLLSPFDLFVIGAVGVVMVALILLFRRTDIGLKLRASAFAPEIARLLGVRVGRMLTLGWALAAVVGSLAGVLIAPSVFVGPNQFDAVLVFGFTAAVIGGLDSPVGAVVGGLVLGCALSYVTGYVSSDIVTLGALAALITVLMVRPNGLFATSAGRRV
ncbi:branched-chain amino acid ABC transporter permease [Actinomadura sp. HBU206391]|uniref:branched-chain amino acid ABC transporter permease n=1 Tax=Actinomadura sp. HBU206391 TaxID=2731692 RepID=UPI00164F12BB|nr:branched-chain amino acid ABC transporter permease [Actinomadura sp. HBU206391]MBC6461309.1 branched-chain amino acid ABC transporter permease [Actinomadura sp. HBU206391]